MESDRLKEIVRRFPKCRVAVIGDFFLDKYLDVDPALAEISLETGKTANQVVAIRRSPGAAGTVVNNLAALRTGILHVLGFTGDDGEGFELRRALGDLGCDRQGLKILQSRFTPTYLKPRNCKTGDLAGEHERYDTKNRLRTPVELQDDVLAYMEFLLPSLDAVIIIDQVDEDECGMITAKVRSSLADFADRYPQKIFWVDSRRRIGLFRNAIIKVNAREAVAETFPGHAEEPRDEIVREAITMLSKRTGRPVFVTAGRRGIWVGDSLPTLIRGVGVDEPTDPTGAGDSATAGAVLALCAGASLQEAALIANLVASITVQELATTGTAAPEELGPRLEMWRRQA